jgi:hypothetical protein
MTDETKDMVVHTDGLPIESTPLTDAFHDRLVRGKVKDTVQEFAVLEKAKREAETRARRAEADLADAQHRVENPVQALKDLCEIFQAAGLDAPTAFVMTDQTITHLRGMLVRANRLSEAQRGAALGMRICDGGCVVDVFERDVFANTHRAEAAEEVVSSAREFLKHGTPGDYVDLENALTEYDATKGKG